MEIAFGKANVVVTDGFAGNVVLKLTEGLTEALLDVAERDVRAALPPDVYQERALPVLRRVRDVMDYAGIGAAPVLGVNGVSVIGHGRSRARAVASAIRQARTAVEHDLVGAIRRGWAKLAQQEGL